MTTLTINDFAIADELEPTQLDAIRGGMIKLPRQEPTPYDNGGGLPAENNLPVMWNDGITGPILIRDR